MSDDDLNDKIYKDVKKFLLKNRDEQIQIIAERLVNTDQTKRILDKVYDNDNDKMVEQIKDRINSSGTLSDPLRIENLKEELIHIFGFDATSLGFFFENLIAYISGVKKNTDGGDYDLFDDETMYELKYTEPYEERLKNEEGKIKKLRVVNPFLEISNKEKFMILLKLTINEHLKDKKNMEEIITLFSNYIYEINNDNSRQIYSNKETEEEKNDEIKNIKSNTIKSFLYSFFNYDDAEKIYNELNGTKSYDEIEQIFKNYYSQIKPKKYKLITGEGIITSENFFLNKEKLIPKEKITDYLTRNIINNYTHHSIITNEFKRLMNENPDSYKKGNIESSDISKLYKYDKERKGTDIIQYSFLSFDKPKKNESLKKRIEYYEKMKEEEKEKRKELINLKKNFDTRAKKAKMLGELINRYALLDLNITEKKERPQGDKMSLTIDGEVKIPNFNFTKQSTDVDLLQKRGINPYMLGNGKYGSGKWALHKVYINRDLGIQKAKQLVKKFIKGNKHFYKEYPEKYNFRNISKQKFKKFRGKKLNDDITLIYGELKPEWEHLEKKKGGLKFEDTEELEECCNNPKCKCYKD